MNIIDENIVFLDSLVFLSALNKRRILSAFEGCENLLTNKNEIKNKLSGIIDESLINKYLLCLTDAYISSTLLEIEKSGINVLTFKNKLYPNKLFQLCDYPIVLYYKGDINLINEQSIAIVGTRNPSNYGSIVTEKLAKELANNGLIIVSGLAEGVDTISHKAALDKHKTIAVLGGGLNKIFPAMNKNLADEIINKGLLITEYMPNVSATKYSFPARNRIIAALSEFILVTEAKMGSGTKYTVDAALDLNLPVGAVPGNITSMKSEYTNYLIKSGAIMVLSSDDILNELNITNHKANEIIVKQLNFDEQEVLDAIDCDETHFEEILSKTNFDTKKLSNLLTRLEISGIIRKVAGNKFLKIDK